MKKTKLILLVVITIMAIQSYSQNSNEFRFYYGTSDSELLREPMLGGGGYESEKFNEFGIKYLKQLFDNFYIETGINYSKSDVKITPDFMGEPVQSRYEKLEIISIPIYANYTFWKYLFVNGGPILDFQTSDNLSDSQSGIGYSLGIGGKYNFKKFILFVNPNYKRHSVIPFEKENNHQKLTEFGVQFGLGYMF